MSAGYSGTPLSQKLGLKAGMTIRIVNAPGDYRALFDVWPDVLIASDEPGAFRSFIHYFAREAAAFRRDLPGLKAEMAPDATLWISWPKKSAKAASDMDENLIRAAALALGLVDVKVCAIDETWSGLKLVIPLKDRPRSPRRRQP